MISKRYTFQPRISAGLSSQLNTNFDDIINAFNSHTHTGIGTDAPVITNSGLAANNAWSNYTPTMTNITQGNGTLVGKYQKLGTQVIGRIEFTFGSTSSLTGPPTFAVPITAHSNYRSGYLWYVGHCQLEDSGVSNYAGVTVLDSTTALRPHTFVVSSTFATLTGWGVGTPITFNTNDKILMTFNYEAAS